MRRFWSIANITTGFSIVQNLAFYITVGPHKGDLYDAVARVNLVWMALIILAGTLLYVLIILFCHRAQRRLTAAETFSPYLKKLNNQWRAAQLLAVIALGGFALLIVVHIHD